MIPCFSCPAALGCLTNVVRFRKASDRLMTSYVAVCNFGSGANAAYAPTAAPEVFVLARFPDDTGKTGFRCPMVIEFNLRQQGVADAKRAAESIAGFAGFARR